MRFRSVGAIEIGLGEEDAGHEQRGVDGRQLDGLEPLAGPHVEEVVEETLCSGDAVRRGTLPQVRSERRVRASAPRRLPRYVAALGADAVGVEPEAHRGDAGERGGRRAIGTSRCAIGQVPEEMEAAALRSSRSAVVSAGLPMPPISPISPISPERSAREVGARAARRRRAGRRVRGGRRFFVAMAPSYRVGREKWRRTLRPAPYMLLKMD